MATAGSIVIDLLMKTGAFETDTKRAEKRLRELEKTAKRAGQVLGTAIVAGGTAAGAALKLTINSMDDMSKAAQKVGASTEEFSKLTYAAGLADVSMETLVSSLGKLTKAQSAALKENSQQARVFDALGISIKNVDGSLRDSTDVLSDFADKFQDLKGSPEAMAAGFAIFGRSFQELIPLLKDGGDGIRSAGEELEAFGGVLSTEAGKNAEEFNDNLTRLETAARSLAQAVAADLLPDLVKLSGNFVSTAKNGETLKETASDIADFFRGLATVAGIVSSAFELVGTGIATVVGQAQAAVKFLTGDMRGAINLYREASAEFDEEVNEALGRSPAARATNPKAKAGKGRRGGGPMNYTPGYDPAEALRLALAEPPKPTGGTGGGGGKSDAQREAEQLDSAYQSLKDSLTETYALFGDNTEAARVLYETQFGGLAGLSQARKDELVALAERNDLQKQGEELQKAADEAVKESTREFERREEIGKRVNEDILEQIELLSMSADEQELWNALAWAGVEAESARGMEISENIKLLQQTREAVGGQIEAMDAVRDAGKGFFMDFVGGSKSFKDSFLDALDSIHQRILSMIAEKLMDQLFGQQGDVGGGSAGGFLGSLFGAFFGGSKAGGGDVFGGRPILVGEQGPEMFVPRTAGTVLTADQTSRHMGGGTQQVITNNLTVQGRIDRRSEQQIAREIGNRTRMAGARA